MTALREFLGLDSYFIRLEMSVVETFICVFLFMLGHKRKKLFWLRIAVAFAASYLSCIPFGKLYSLSVGTQWFLSCKIFVYLSTYLAVVAVFFFCYKDRVSELFLCGVAGIAAQSLLSNVSSILFRNWELPRGNALIYQSLDLLRQSPIFAAIWLIFAYHSPHLPENGSYGGLIVLATATMIVTIGLGGIVPVYAEESAALALVGELFSIMCALFVLVLRRGLIAQMSLRRDFAVEEALRTQEQKQYDQLKNSMEQVNVKCHDLKHQLARLRGKLDEDTLAGLSSAVNAFDSVFRTNNETLDIILNEKNYDCLRRGIRFTCMGDGAAFAHIKPADLYSLFGNALDNAIEAVDRLPQAEKRAINLHLSSEQGAELDLMNYFSGRLALRGGLPVTTKQDAAYHGFGVRSMQLTVQSYGGEMYFSAEDDVFRLHIRFPVHPTDQTE